MDVETDQLYKKVVSYEIFAELSHLTDCCHLLVHLAALKNVRRKSTADPKLCSFEYIGGFF